MNTKQILLENENLKKENAELRLKIDKLEAELKKAKGGRPSSVTEQEREMIKMYRLQGKTMREIAKLFNKSLGTIHNILTNDK